VERAADTVGFKIVIRLPLTDGVFSRLFPRRKILKNSFWFFFGLKIPNQSLLAMLFRTFLSLKRLMILSQKEV